MNRYVIERRDDGTFSLIESDDQGNVWPMTVKRSAREVVARLSQLLGIGPVAPQMTPETVLLGEDAEDAPPVESLLALAEAVHASDCAVHNGPALPVGPCTCGAVPPPAPATEHGCNHERTRLDAGAGRERSETCLDCGRVQRWEAT